MKAKRKDTQVPQLSGPTESVADEDVYKELDDSLVRAATTASILEAECQDTIRDTIAHTRVLDLEQTKTTQAIKINSLKRMVKKLEKKQTLRTHKLKILYKVGLTTRVESSDDEQSLGKDASKHRRISDIDADEGITLVSTYDYAEMFDADKHLHAQALTELKHTKPKAKAKWIVFHEPEESTTTTKATISKPTSHDKQREQKNRGINHQRKLNKEKTMCTYLKNVEGKKLTDLKNKSFDSIQKMFDRAFKRVNIFVDFKTELVEGSSKRAGEELTQKSAKKQKVDDDKQIADLKQLMKIILEKEIEIYAIPLAVKLLIVDWKIYKEGKKSYYKIIRAGGKSKMYLIFSQMLKDFDKEDLEDFYNLVKAKYGSTRLVEDLDLILWG
nr:hypothetical protein [Tanacetum cinerariifolium]